MKKYSHNVLIVCFLMLSFLSQAQMRKGSIFVGVNMGGTFSQSSNSVTYVNFQTSSSTPWNYAINFNPEGGYFVSDKFSVGMNFGFSYTKFTQNFGLISPDSVSITANTTSTVYSIMPNAKYYFKFSDQFALALGGYGYFGFASYPVTVSFSNAISPISTPTIIRGLGFGLVPSLMYSPHPKWTINFSLGNLFSIINQTQTISANSNLNFGNGQSSSISISQSVSNTTINVLGLSSIISPVQGSSSFNSVLYPFSPYLSVYFWFNRK